MRHATRVCSPRPTCYRARSVEAMPAATTAARAAAWSRNATHGEEGATPARWHSSAYTRRTGRAPGRPGCPAGTRRTRWPRAGRSSVPPVRRQPALPTRCGADERQDRSADVFGQGRPHSHERGQFGIGDAPFACVTTPGTTPGGVSGRKLFVLLGVRTRRGPPSKRVVVGSSPAGRTGRTHRLLLHVPGRLTPRPCPRRPRPPPGRRGPAGRAATGRTAARTTAAATGRPRRA